MFGVLRENSQEKVFWVGKKHVMANHNGELQLPSAPLSASRTNNRRHVRAVQGLSWLLKTFNNLQVEPTQSFRGLPTVGLPFSFQALELSSLVARSLRHIQKASERSVGERD